MLTGSDITGWRWMGVSEWWSIEVFDAEQFDAAIERDARSGKLDTHADAALAAHRAGRSREL